MAAEPSSRPAAPPVVRAIHREADSVTAAGSRSPRLGKLYRRTSKRQEAQAHLTTATTMYREMGMTHWLEQAEKEINELE